MRWRVFAPFVFFFGLLFHYAAPVAATDEGPTGGGRYSASVTLRRDEGTSVTRHELTLPWNFSPLGDKYDPVDGTVVVDFEHRDDGAFAWNGQAKFRGRRLSAALYLRRPHRSSQDAFKLVHASARGEDSVAAVLDWTGNGTATFQYVQDVPLRRNPGTLLSARFVGPASDGAVGFTAYGSERVQHLFVTLDGRTTLGDWPIEWGGALLRGVEVSDGTGPGLVVHRQVQDGAAFVRTEWRFGSHNGWTRFHVTGAEFRSLVADTYPFARGKGGVEGRWQWRLGTGKLLSVYGQRLQSLNPEFPQTEHNVELGFSFMVRNAWGWRLSVEGRTTGEKLDFGRLEGSLTNPDRRFEWTVGTTPDRGGPAQWRHRLQWDEGRWRVRILVDESFGGWRAEGRVTDPDGWSWTVVYKAPFGNRSNLPDRWIHGELRRSISGFGQLWVRYMEPDLGRIDVGWRRPPTVSVGVDVSF